MQVRTVTDNLATCLLLQPDHPMPAHDQTLQFMNSSVTPTYCSHGQLYVAHSCVGSPLHGTVLAFGRILEGSIAVFSRALN